MKKYQYILNDIYTTFSKECKFSPGTLEERGVRIELSPQASIILREIKESIYVFGKDEQGKVISLMSLKPGQTIPFFHFMPMFKKAYPEETKVLRKIYWRIIALMKPPSIQFIKSL